MLLSSNSVRMDMPILVSESPMAQLDGLTEKSSKQSSKITLIKSNPIPEGFKIPKKSNSQKNDEKMEMIENSDTPAQDNLEDGEVPDSDEDISIVNITESAREPRRPMKMPPKVKRQTKFDKDLEKVKNSQKKCGKHERSRPRGISDSSSSSR